MPCSVNRAVVFITALVALALLIQGCTSGKCSTDYEQVADLDSAAASISQALAKQLTCDLYLQLPEGKFVGTILLPGGVHLRGAGAGKTVITSPEDPGDSEAVVTIQPGSGRTSSLDNLTVSTGSLNGVSGTGEGKISLSNFIVEVSSYKQGGGTGIMFKDLAEFEISNSRASGNVNASNAGSVGPSTITNYAAQGLYASNCTAGKLSGFSVKGFSWAGATFSGAGNFSWDSVISQSDLHETVRLGLLVADKAVLNVDGLNIESVWQGLFSDTGFGAVTIDSSLNGTTVTFANTSYIGLLSQNSSVNVTGLKISGALVGVWSQKTDGSPAGGSLSLAGAEITDVKGIAVGGHGLDSFKIDGGKIARVQQVVLPSESGAGQPMGDGIQILKQTGNVTIKGVTLSACERAAVVLDPKPGEQGQSVAVSGDFTGTSIEGAGQWAFVPQNAAYTGSSPDISKFDNKDHPVPGFTLPVKSVVAAPVVVQ